LSACHQLVHHAVSLADPTAFNWLAIRLSGQAVQQSHANASARPKASSNSSARRKPVTLRGCSPGPEDGDGRDRHDAEFIGRPWIGFDVDLDHIDAPGIPGGQLVDFRCHLAARPAPIGLARAAVGSPAHNGADSAGLPGKPGHTPDGLQSGPIEEEVIPLATLRLGDEAEHQPVSIPYRPPRPTSPQALERARRFRAQMTARRSVRMFSAEPVPRELIEHAIMTAASAPSGAHQQPWTFVAVSDPAIKHRIRIAAEQEERRNYEGGRMPAEWRSAIAPLGTDWRKPFLETVPWLIILFEQVHGWFPDGSIRKHYYARESVGIACGLFIGAIQQMGLATLTHTPYPCASWRASSGVRATSARSCCCRSGTRHQTVRCPSSPARASTRWPSSWRTDKDCKPGYRCARLPSGRCN
jgi:iodotyrosine deiodinase